METYDGRGTHVVLGGLLMHVRHWEMLGPAWWEGSYCVVPDKNGWDPIESGFRWSAPVQEDAAKPL